jgi:polyhydroxybutyrate depolymerase
MPAMNARFRPMSRMMAGLRRMPLAATAAALAVAMMLEHGAVATRAQTAGSDVRALTVGGLARTYRMYHPASANARPALVVMLHGGFGSGAEAESAYGWDELASARGFVVAYPDGVARAWNAGRCCGRPYEQKIDDVAFLTAVIRDAEARDGVDPRRVYVTGMSNGAIMAYRLACEAPIPIAAIGPVAGDLEVACAAPRAPVSVLAIHGTADQNVPIGGGLGTKGFTRTEHTSLAASLAKWRAIDRCVAPSGSRQGALATERSSCAAGTDVDAVTIEGAGHQWPGSKPPRAAAVRLLGLDQPSTALDATGALWSFFERHTAAAS